MKAQVSNEQTAVSSSSLSASSLCACCVCVVFLQPYVIKIDQCACRRNRQIFKEKSV